MGVSLKKMEGFINIKNDFINSLSSASKELIKPLNISNYKVCYNCKSSFKNFEKTNIANYTGIVYHIIED
jgi:hypothetical protein